VSKKLLVDCRESVDCLSDMQLPIDDGLSRAMIRCFSNSVRVGLTAISSAKSSLNIGLTTAADVHFCLQTSRKSFINADLQCFY